MLLPIIPNIKLIVVNSPKIYAVIRVNDTAQIVDIIKKLGLVRIPKKPAIIGMNIIGDQKFAASHDNDVILFIDVAKIIAIKPMKQVDNLAKNNSLFVDIRGKILLKISCAHNTPV